ncbi:globin [Paenactinomyces guangxiensis]|uniref:Globin n=1 Tax=Paenactinomyces guangxiensis TaxID=1490290 RepID=A0A7W1WSZ2_9BACL|nr:globin [Paenactinomyces guangxiensis]MBA4495432.1 globin [Paenactinomyces guangxiensis]MBH8592447.1 globin [Paenactinomyces guangxiensis]
MSEPISLYDKIGGAEKVRQLVEAFYPRVQAHPLLKPLFPEDIEPVMEKQYLFLTQFLGGPPLYTEKRGHPMLRARHLPFPITPARANAWLQCMEQALNEVGITGPERDAIWGRLVIAAHHMVNQPEPFSE